MELRSVTFEGCKGAGCKGVAVSVAGIFFASFVYPTAYGDECWDRPQAWHYCQPFMPEQPHDHNDHRPANEQRSIQIMISSSTSSSSPSSTSAWIRGLGPLG